MLMQKLGYFFILVKDRGCTQRHAAESIIKLDL